MGNPVDNSNKSPAVSNNHLRVSFFSKKLMRKTMHAVAKGFCFEIKASLCPVVLLRHFRASCTYYSSLVLGSPSFRFVYKNPI
jgi:hypothetical protein